MAATTDACSSLKLLADPLLLQGGDVQDFLLQRLVFGQIAKAAGRPSFLSLRGRTGWRNPPGPNGGRPDSRRGPRRSSMSRSSIRSVLE